MGKANDGMNVRVNSVVKVKKGWIRVVIRRDQQCMLSVGQTAGAEDSSIILQIVSVHVRFMIK